jgi:hypothetical protein
MQDDFDMNINDRILFLNNIFYLIYFKIFLFI